MKRVILSMFLLIALSTMAQNVNGDFNALGVRGGEAIKIIENSPAGSYEDIFDKGIWISHDNRKIKVNRDNQGRVKVANGIKYIYNDNGIVSSLVTSDGSRQDLKYWGVYEIGAVTGDSNWNYFITKFNSHGDWTEMEMIVDANGLKRNFSRTRDITYADTKPDNSITVLDSFQNPVIGCVLFVCDSEGNKLDFIRGYVSDLDGKIYNLPYSKDIKYLLQFYGFKDALVASNPNAVIIMKE